MSNAPIPRPALLLGAAGLLPSLAMPPLLAAGGDAAAFALQAGPAYGALIASFIGGAWWGLAANRAEGAALTRWLVASVLPMLAAWVALLLPPQAGLLLLAVIFALLPLADRAAQAASMAPAWWWRLRLPLSLLMACLHGVSAGMALNDRGFSLPASHSLRVPLRAISPLLHGQIGRTDLASAGLPPRPYPRSF